MIHPGRGRSAAVVAAAGGGCSSGFMLRAEVTTATVAGPFCAWSLKYPPAVRGSPVASAAVTRQCSRPGCAEAAEATLTYQYSRSVAWLDALSDDRDPHGYDLCARHASRLRVPHGWRLEERRPFLAQRPAPMLAG